MQLSEYKYKVEFAVGIIQSSRSGCAIVLFLATRYFRVGFDNYRLPISRYRRQYGAKVNRSKKKRKQDVIAFVNTVTQLIHRGSYAHIVTLTVRKFS